MNPKRHLIGLDFGKTQDFTALCILQRTLGPTPAELVAEGKAPADPNKQVWLYSARMLKRWQLGTKYTAIVRDVGTIVTALDAEERQEHEEYLRKLSPYQRQQHELDPSTWPKIIRLAADATGVGQPIMELLHDAKADGKLPCRVTAVTITGGHRVTGLPDELNVPKRDLVGAMKVLLQTRRLKISNKLPEGEVLAKELENFETEITLSANETFGAWREGQNDDLVLAAALAAWIGELEAVPCDDTVANYDPYPEDFDGEDFPPLLRYGQ